MKNLIIIVALGFGLLACTSNTEKTESDNIDLVKSYIKAVEELDFEAMSTYLDDNYLGMGPSYGDSIGKYEAVANWEWSVSNLYEKIHYTRSQFASVNIPDGPNKGEWVANWAELNIDYKDGPGTVTLWANSNYLIKDGKILKSFTFYNEADAIRQLEKQSLSW